MAIVPLRCDRVEREVGAIVDECHDATAKFSEFASTHEAIAVIREEYKELEDEVFWGLKPCQAEALANWRGTLGAVPSIATEGRLKEAGAAAHREKCRAEAIQLGAMALRFLVDFPSLDE